MLLYTGLLLLCTALSNASPVQHPLTTQDVLDLSHASSQEGNPRKLRGKFLHITDIHPDPFYEQGTDPFGDHPCHAGHGRAGYFGAEKTECDTPLSLVNATFDWIKHNIKDDIDFVLWTGDSARHDNDEKYPRTRKGVEELNGYIVAKFDEVFGKPDHRNDPDPTNDFVVPIVPTFGNNDILPHNIFEPGPNKWTRKYLSIWEKFIPQEQRHNFARGGWFFTEVIPNKLAVFSLNTLYFFDSNAAVDGCDDPSEPGYEHFEWLRIQLEFLRERKMKAILMGHVPPARTESKQNWDESCHQKYTLWLRQYRDVIVGNIFGHMNVDHFILQDVRELRYKFKIPGIDDEGLRDRGSSLSDGFDTQAKSDYLSDLRQLWGNLPSPPNGVSYMETDVDVDTFGKNKKKKKTKKQKRDKFLKEIGGPFGERFSLSVVSPSVVPNFYPTLRIIEYNISGLKHDHPALRPTAPAESDIIGSQALENFEEEILIDDIEVSFTDEDDHYDIDKKKKHKKKKGRKARPNFRIPDPPSKSSPPGPGYSPQPLSFISWKQLYANLTKINEAVAKDLNHGRSAHGHDFNPTSYERIAKKHFQYELEYDTQNDTIRPLKDLTIRSWLDYAEKISRAKYSDPSGKFDSVPPFSEGDRDSDDELAELVAGFELDRFFSAHDPEEEAIATEFEYHPGQVIATCFPHYLACSDDTSHSEFKDSIEADKHNRMSVDCLLALWNLHNAGLKRYNADDHYSLFLKLFQKIDQELASMDCQSVHDLLNIIPDAHEEDEEENAEDIDYESDSEGGSEDSEVDEDDDDEYVHLERKKHKCKGKHTKTCKRRKGESLKKNHLWHHFVRRAFVGTKSWQELIDEFG